MSVYSPYDVYPSEADELYICPQDNCENCTFDCENRVYGVEEVD